MSDRDDPGPRLTALRNDLQHVEGQVLALRVALLRLCALAPLVLLALGLILPIWSEPPPEEDEPRVVRIATLGPLILSDIAAAGEDDSSVALGVALMIGFVGLTLTTVILGWALVSSVMMRSGRSRFRWVRTTAATLTIIGSAIACLFSATAGASEASDTSGGWGAVVLLAGAIVAAVLIRHWGWHDLWLDVNPTT